jgi:copper chaperone CopZ
MTKVVAGAVVVLALGAVGLKQAGLIRRGHACCGTGLGECCPVETKPEHPDATVIHVDGRTCGGCAASVAKAVSGLAGVQDVATDPKSGTVTVIPKAGATVSPKALWEAVDEAGFTPTRIAGPNGSLTEKPSE